MRRSGLKKKINESKVSEIIRGALRGLFYALLVFNLAFLGTPFQFSNAYAQSSEAMTGNPDAPMSIDEQRQACNNDAARQWDNELNSCVVKQEVMDTKENSIQCQNSNNPEECYKNEAVNQTGVGANDAFQGKSTEALAARISAIYAIFALIAGAGAGDGLTRTSEEQLDSEGGEGSCTSKKIFTATSIAWTVGDLYLKKTANKNFDKIAESYKVEVKNEHQKGGEAGSYQAQVRAFHYLREEQQQVKEQADKRTKLQMAVALGFGVTLGFAIYEQTPAGWANACKSFNEEETKDLKEKQASQDSSKTKLDESSKSMADNDAATDQTQVKNHEANQKDYEAKKKAYDDAMSEYSSWVNQVLKFGTSAQISLGAGLMMALNVYLINHAKGEKNRAETNIKAIDYMMKSFAEYASGFCPDGRDDLNNERCYCYNDDGSQNSNRSKSVICQNLYKADNINYALTNPKLKSLTDGPRQGCITVTGQFDEDCKCRKMINNVSKQNACSKAPNSLALSSALGTQLGAGQAMSSLGSFPQGSNRALASLNSANLSNRAAKQKKLLDSMIAQAKSKGINVPDNNTFEKVANKLVNEREKRLGRFGPMAMRGNSMFSGNRPRPKGMDKAIAMAEEKAGVSGNPIIGSGKGVGAIGSSGKKKGFKFDWNDTAAREGNKVQTFMDKNYKYKDSDIVKREDVSLWNVISRRYQTSGLKRLFGEDDD